MRATSRDRVGAGGSTEGTQRGGTCGQGSGTVSIYASPTSRLGAGQADPQKGPKGGRLQPLFRGTVPAKIYDGRKPSDSTAPASRDPSAFLWPVARPQGRPRLPAGLPGGWGRVGGGFGVRRVLGHSGGNTGHYDGSPFLWGVKCIQGAPAVHWMNHPMPPLFMGRQMHTGGTPPPMRVPLTPRGQFPLC